MLVLELVCSVMEWVGLAYLSSSIETEVSLRQSHTAHVFRTASLFKAIN